MKTKIFPILLGFVILLLFSCGKEQVCERPILSGMYQDVTSQDIWEFSPSDLFNICYESSNIKDVYSFGFYECTTIATRLYVQDDLGIRPDTFPIRIEIDISPGPNETTRLEIEGDWSDIIFLRKL